MCLKDPRKSYLEARFITVRLWPGFGQLMLRIHFWQTGTFQTFRVVLFTEAFVLFEVSVSTIPASLPVAITIKV